jgi:hypothetical protein
MEENKARPHPKKTESERESRLKSALKANLQKRKAQAKMRGQAAETSKEES